MGQSNNNSSNNHHKEEEENESDQITFICLDELLSSCIDANLRGCEVIRQYYCNNKDNDDTTKPGTLLKEAGDIKSVVTQADVDAQKVIVGGLRRLWGNNLRIIGEEEDDDNDDDGTNKETRLRKNLLASSSAAGGACNANDNKVAMEELTVFVDPLDGTREFVEGRIQNVGCLIGVARRGKAILGTIGVPFPAGTADRNENENSTATTPVVHYAVSASDETQYHGIFPTTAKQEANEDENTRTIAIFTGDSTNPVLVNATNRAIRIATDRNSASSSSNNNVSSPKPPNHVVLGGTAAKLMSVARRENSMAVLHFKTCCWDTCAPEALLRCRGGKITDLFGSPLVHLPNDKYNFGNVFGVVVSSPGMAGAHDKLCTEMRSDSDAVQTVLGRCTGKMIENKTAAAAAQQAVDVARDLDGYPLDRSWLEEQLLNHNNQSGDDEEKGYSLRGYSVPEAFAVRGPTSTEARLCLDWEKIDHENDGGSNNNNSANDNHPPATVYYKRAVVSGLSRARMEIKTAPGDKVFLEICVPIGW